MSKRLAAMTLLAAAGTWQCGGCLMAQSDAAVPPAADANTSSGGITASDPGELTDANSKFFESTSAGISLRIPAGCQNVVASGAGDDIGQYADPIRKWEIKLQRTTHPEALALQSTVDRDGKPVIGMLDKAARDLRLNLAGFIVRQDTINIADPGVGTDKQVNNVGMIAVRYTSGSGRYLMQEAMVRSTSRIYFSIAFTAPIGDGKLDSPTPTPMEVTAVKTFSRIIDSVRLLDGASLKREQDARLLRAEILLYKLHSRARVQAAILDKQWLRVLRNGRDVGYSYITEQNAGGPLKLGKPDQNRGDGLLVGIRGRTILPPQPGDAVNNKPAKPLQVDVASWWFLSEDQKQEEWSRVTVTTELGADGKPAKQPVQHQYTEFGSTGIESHRQLDKQAYLYPGAKVEDAQQPPVVNRQQRILDGTNIDPTGASQPFTQPLPTLYYLPQALSTMLPRLIELRPDIDNTPRTYMFLTYVPDNRKVMSRYVEVGNEGDFDLGTEHVHAIPITDRLGWHGSVTTHYVTPSGIYLGSENKDAHTVTLVTTAEDLQKIWKNADLTQPGAIERPHPGAASAGSREIPPLIRENNQAANVQGPPSPIR